MKDEYFEYWVGFGKTQRVYFDLATCNISRMCTEILADEMVGICDCVARYTRAEMETLKSKQTILTHLPAGATS